MDANEIRRWEALDPECCPFCGSVDWSLKDAGDGISLLMQGGSQAERYGCNTCKSEWSLVGDIRVRSVRFVPEGPKSA